jgi:hypothetical protein
MPTVRWRVASGGTNSEWLVANSAPGDAWRAGELLLPLASPAFPFTTRYSLLATRYSLLATRYSLLTTPTRHSPPNRTRPGRPGPLHFLSPLATQTYPSL